MTQEELRSLIERDVTSRHKDGTFSIKCVPEDITSEFSCTDDAVYGVSKNMPEKYFNSLIGFKCDPAFSGCVYLPIFDQEMQDEWDDDMRCYIEEKMEMCAKYWFD